MRHSGGDLLVPIAIIALLVAIFMPVITGQAPMPWIPIIIASVALVALSYICRFIHNKICAHLDKRLYPPQEEIKDDN
tara:strand:+ start:133408 stop:133641 length:234 start_codon:yes stop_codon:yes gene_type:complete